MPKMTVYLPDDLFAIVKERDLPVSELLQDAIRREMILEAKGEAADRLASELIEEYGEPSARDVAWAQSLVRRGKKPSKRRAG
jgi:post-segregation antitoxin (ccd killing protein)